MNQPGLQLRTAQTLTLTPQLQQAIRLLQLSTLEMQQELQQMLADNPFLEQVEEEVQAVNSADEAHQNDALDESGEDAYDDPLPDTCALLADDACDFATLREHSDDWSAAAHNESHQPASSDDHDDRDERASERSLDDTWDGSNASNGNLTATEDDDEPHDARESAHTTLYDHLHHQALGLRLGEEDRAALYCLIESLNADGYLEDSLGEVAQSLLAHNQAQADDPDEAFSQLLHHLTVALRLLRTLEPVGVGARNLAECLQLQLQAMPLADDQTAQLLVREVALALCQQPLEYVARRDVRGLQKLTGFAAPQIKSAMHLISTLEPKPGRRFADVERNAIVPDVLVRRNTGAGAAKQPWRIELNPAILPRVRVQEMYANALRQHRGGDCEALQQRLQEARWMVKSIQQRFDTILRVAQAIVARQHRFFAEGVMAMEPMVLREIAEELELHESTISRVTTAKYMATPWGTFELKYFFSSALGSDDGSSASSTAVRALLQQFIAAEPPAKPLSDNKLCDMLQAQGIQCARRTVAKYRDALQIPPAHLRKTLQQ